MVYRAYSNKDLGYRVILGLLKVMSEELVAPFNSKKHDKQLQKVRTWVRRCYDSLPRISFDKKAQKKVNRKIAAIEGKLIILWSGTKDDALYKAYASLWVAASLVLEDIYNVHKPPVPRDWYYLKTVAFTMALMVCETEDIEEIGGRLGIYISDLLFPHP